MPTLGKKHTRNLNHYTRRLIFQYAAYTREAALAKVTEGADKATHEAQAKLYHTWARETEQILAGLGVYPGVVFFEGMTS